MLFLGGAAAAQPGQGRGAQAFGFNGVGAGAAHPRRGRPRHPVEHRLQGGNVEKLGTFGGAIDVVQGNLPGLRSAILGRPWGLDKMKS